MLNKKGETAQPGGTQEIFGVSRSLMILLAFFLLFGSYLIFGFIDRGDFFEKQVTANRIGINMDGLQLFDGNAFMIDTVIWNNTYNVNVSGNRVRVYDDAGGQNYFFAKDGNVQIPKALHNDTRRLVYLKQGDKLEVLVTDTIADFNSFQMDCRGSRQSISQIHINPRLPGSKQDNSTIVTGLLTRFRSFDDQFYKTETPVSATQATLPAVLSLTLGNQSEGKNIVKAYVSSHPAKLGNSQLLACTIINAISAEMVANKRQVTGTAIIPVWEGSIEQDSSLQVLKKSNVAVVLELGNQQQVKPDWLLSYFQSIDRGIKQYGVSRVAG